MKIPNKNQIFFSFLKDNENKNVDIVVMVAQLWMFIELYTLNGWILWLLNKDAKRKKYQTKAKLIEHITQIKDLKVDRKNIINGLYKKVNNLVKDEDEHIDVSDDEEEK